MLLYNEQRLVKPCRQHRAASNEVLREGGLQRVASAHMDHPDGYPFSTFKIKGHRQL